MVEMENVPDARLLREFATRGNDAAFREIVSRHTDLIFSAALRQVNSPDSAADIAQKVFCDLAHKAGEVAEKFSADASLAGWLFRSTRFAALNHLRDESRRRAHERQAMEQLLTNSESAADWEQIRPLLDEAMDTLNDDDRDALLLRFFKNKNLREVGEQLKISDDAAQKRVSRAVEKLREFFTKRKITMGASGLTILISANAVQAAPLGLAAKIFMFALAGKTISTSTVIAATKTIAMTTLQKTLVVAALTAAIGTGIYEAHQNSQLREQVQSLQQAQSPLNEQLAQLQHERDDATNQLAGLLAENVQLKSNSNEDELLKLRGEVSVLSAQLATAKSLAAKSNLSTSLTRASADGLNQAMLDYLGNSIPPPPNMDAAYTREGLSSAIQNAAQAASITLKRVEIDDSEFPFLIGVKVEKETDMQKLIDEIKKLNNYNYNGSISSATEAAMNLIPSAAYPQDLGNAIEKRVQLRQQMLFNEINSSK
jgi:RNA polymerase sigma factor (sigma-70 family)